MKLVPFLFLFTLVSCSSINYGVTDENGSIEMTAIKSYPVFFDDEEKMKIVISKADGGRIEGISWEGKSLITNPILEGFPNKSQSFKSLNPSFIQDDEDGGLTYVIATKPGVYQFTRSYTAEYDEETDEYEFKVIYNVKNRSSKEILTYQWTKDFSVNGKPTQTSKAALSIVYPDNKVKMKVNLTTIKASYLITDGKKIKMGNGIPLKLGAKGQLNWTVTYRLSPIND
jgi:hypothetical protein